MTRTRLGLSVAAAVAFSVMLGLSAVRSDAAVRSLSLFNTPGTTSVKAVVEPGETLVNRPPSRTPVRPPARSPVRP